MLNINKTIENGKAVFNLEGRLDMITAPMLEEQLLASLNGVKELILDFKDLVYISSAGIRQLVSIYKKMNGQLVIKNASVELKDIFHITGMDRMIKFE